MDPKETLAAALRALALGHADGCLAYLLHYRQFRDNGGRQPLNGDARAKLINELLTLA